jgi:pentatricopeptide repeat protein
MVASNVAGAELTFMVMSVYLKRRQFKDFMDVLEKLKKRGRF